MWFFTAICTAIGMGFLAKEKIMDNAYDIKKQEDAYNSGSRIYYDGRGIARNIRTQNEVRVLKPCMYPGSANTRLPVYIDSKTGEIVENYLQRKLDELNEKWDCKNKKYHWEYRQCAGYNDWENGAILQIEDSTGYPYKVRSSYGSYTKIYIEGYVGPKVSNELARSYNEITREEYKDLYGMLC